MNKNSSIFKTIGLMITLLCAMTGCESNIVFQDAATLAESSWYKKDIVSFEYDAQDTTELYNVIIDIRNEADYPYKNFWLFVHSTSPQGIDYSDTLECVLADNFGRWIGKSSGSLYALPVLFLSNTRFPQKGIYHFDLIQGMRSDTLKGIHEIGIRIEKAEAKQ